LSLFSQISAPFFQMFCGCGGVAIAQLEEIDWIVEGTI